MLQITMTIEEATMRLAETEAILEPTPECKEFICYLKGYIQGFNDFRQIHENPNNN